MALVIKLKLPGRSLPEARENLELVRQAFLKAAAGKADLYADLVWQLEGKAEIMRTRDITRKRKRRLIRW